MVSKSKNAGGAATQAGLNYQNRVAAWFCTRILAEHDSVPLWNLQANTTFEFLRCETEQPVDDILVGTSAGGFIFINVKHTVKANKQTDSPLGSVINQFVRQYTAYSERLKGERLWERKLNPDIDRLVLITSSNSSPAIKEFLPRVLTKLRNISSQINLGTFAGDLPRSEKEIFVILRKQLAASWFNSLGSDITNEDELQLLKLVRVEILDVDADTAG